MLKKILLGVAVLLVVLAIVIATRPATFRIERSLISWSAVVRTPVSHDQLTNVVPGVPFELSDDVQY